MANNRSERRKIKTIETKFLYREAGDRTKNGNTRYELKIFKLECKNKCTEAKRTENVRDRIKKVLPQCQPQGRTSVEDRYKVPELEVEMTFRPNASVGLGGLGVTCSPRDPRFAGSNPT